MEAFALAALPELGKPYVHGEIGLDGPSTNCSIFAFRVLRRVYPAIDWRAHQPAMMIVDPTRTPWSNTEALVRAGVGRQVGGPTPGRWHYAQGWRSLSGPGGTFAKGDRGHCWLYWSPPTPSMERGCVLEATDARVEWFREESWADRVAPFRGGVRVVALGEGA